VRRAARWRGGADVDSRSNGGPSEVGFFFFFDSSGARLGGCGSFSLECVRGSGKCLWSGMAVSSTWGFKRRGQ